MPYFHYIYCQIHLRGLGGGPYTYDVSALVRSLDHVQMIVRPSRHYVLR